MNALLTSGGLKNEELRQTFVSLLKKPPEQTSVAVIPTASRNMESKDWFYKDIEDLKSTGIAEVRTVEISDLDRSEWLPMLEASDVIFVPGGDVYFLRDEMVRTGLSEALPTLLDTKVYVGISAGSRVLNPDISIAALYYDPAKDPTGLHMTDFCIVPHMNSPRFPDRTPDKIQKLVKDFPHTTYLMDDNSAVLIQGSMMQLVGGGEYKEYNA